MTDYEKMIEMLKKAQIEFSVGGTYDAPNIQVDGGYIGFYSLFVFDSKENLVKVEAYE